MSDNNEIDERVSIGKVHVADAPVDNNKPIVKNNKMIRSKGRPTGVPNVDTKPYGKMTPQKKRKFLEKLARTGNLHAAAADIGMSRSSMYKLMARDTAFRQRVEMARDKASGNLDEAAYKRGVEGVDKPIYNRNGQIIGTEKVYSDKLLMKLMEANDPERHGKGKRTENNININISAEDSAKAKLASLLDIKLPGHTLENEPDEED